MTRRERHERIIESWGHDRACTFWVGTTAMIVLPNDIDAGEIAALDLHERFHANGYCHVNGSLFGWVYCGVPAQRRAVEMGS